MQSSEQRFSEFVATVTRFTVDETIAAIGRELSGVHDEPYGGLLKGLRYFLTHNGFVPNTLTKPDRDIVKPLAEALVERGVSNGGLPPEALAGFDRD